MIFQRGGCRVSTTFDVHAKPLGQGEPELGEEELLPAIRPTDAPEPERAPIGRLEQEVPALDPAQAVEGVCRGAGTPPASGCA